MERMNEKRVGVVAMARMMDGVVGQKVEMLGVAEVELLAKRAEQEKHYR